MEKRLNKKIETYVTTFKDNINSKIQDLQFEDKQKAGELIAFIYEYERLTLLKDDLSKRKRIKNSIPDSNRCDAKRANGEQCTRRRKEGCEYCGTHAKGTPNGMMKPTDGNNKYGGVQHVEVFAQEMFGIVYYIDNNQNVYKTEDILSEKQNPEIIAKYELKDDKYSIPSLGLV
jgi:hypothetical protein